MLLQVIKWSLLFSPHWTDFLGPNLFLVTNQTTELAGEKKYCFSLNKYTLILSLFAQQLLFFFKYWGSVAPSIIWGCQSPSYLSLHSTFVFQPGCFYLLCLHNSPWIHPAAMLCRPCIMPFSSLQGPLCVSASSKTSSELLLSQPKAPTSSLPQGWNVRRLQ